VLAAALSTIYPAERLLRSIMLAEKEAQIFYVDMICAAEKGAAYRLLCDLVERKRAACPEQRLIVVLTAVVSSQVLGSYERWGFTYGGLVDLGNSQPPLVANWLPQLRVELGRFEAYIESERSGMLPQSTSLEGAPLGGSSGPIQTQARRSSSTATTSTAALMGDERSDRSGSNRSSLDSDNSLSNSL
jgi:hypothetical protein